MFPCLGVGGSYIKGSGMFIISLRGVNYRFGLTKGAQDDMPIIIISP